MDLSQAQSNETIAETAELPRRFERKFFILPKNIGFAHLLLRQFCRPDPEFPKGQVNSLYFDTLDLEQYDRSESGEFKKDKVRIRWYGDIGSDKEEVTVFLELKSRQGFASTKQRQKMSVPVQQLKQALRCKGIVSRWDLIKTLSMFGHWTALPLQPIVVISYHRYRFNEISTGTRVSLDFKIRSSMVAPEIGWGEKSLELKGGVIEVKGSNLELPKTLRHLKLLNIDWSRFSKYGQCLDAHLSAPGTVSRLWPMGRVVRS